MFPVNLFQKDNQNYTVPNSLRFDGKASFLTYTPGFGGINYKQTQSVWFRLTRQGDHNGILLSSYRSSGPKYWLWRIVSNRLYVYHNTGVITTSLEILRSQDELFTDINGWHNIVAVLDTHQASPANRLKIYLNGELITRWIVDSRSSIIRYTEARPFAHPEAMHTLGKNYPAYDDVSLNFFEGYLADYHLIDGEAISQFEFGKYLYFGKKRLWVPKNLDKNHNANGVNLKFFVLEEKKFDIVGTDYKLDPKIKEYTRSEERRVGKECRL